MVRLHRRIKACAAWVSKRHCPLWLVRPQSTAACGGVEVGPRLIEVKRNRNEVSFVVKGGARKEAIMTRRTIVSLVAAVVVGIASVATISTDAFARGGR